MNCERCGGLKVYDHFYGSSASLSVWSYSGLRCLNCGNITDVPGNDGRPFTPIARSTGERRWSDPVLRQRRMAAEALFDTV
ncbi:MAG TPA: hypothetical protein VFQ34_04710 [Nitrospiraceae bacterium]|jgi:hypothetical protein|nr:hypothetical protein [Nitrospiraceae bacterium]